MKHFITFDVDKRDSPQKCKCWNQGCKTQISSGPKKNLHIIGPKYICFYPLKGFFLSSKQAEWMKYSAGPIKTFSGPHLVHGQHAVCVLVCPNPQLGFTIKYRTRWRTFRTKLTTSGSRLRSSIPIPSGPGKIWFWRFSAIQYSLIIRGTYGTYIYCE